MTRKQKAHKADQSRSAFELSRLRVALKELARLLEVESRRLADGRLLGSTIIESLESHSPALAYKITAIAVADLVNRVETLEDETRHPAVLLANDDRELLKDVA